MADDRIGRGARSSPRNNRPRNNRSRNTPDQRMRDYAMRTPGPFPPNTRGASASYPGRSAARARFYSSRTSGAGGKPPRRRPLRHGCFVSVITVLTALSIVIFLCCNLGAIQLANVAAAAFDARNQVNAIEGLVKGGYVTDTNHLNEIQTRLTTLNSDLLRLQGALPGQVASTSTGINLNNTLTMALNFVRAGQYSVDAALILVPHLKGALQAAGSASAAPTPTVSGAASVTAGPTPTTAPLPGNIASGSLTMDEVTRAQQDVVMAGMFAERALAQRQNINEGQLSAIGLGSIVSILHRLDSFAPKLPTYLSYANSVMSALPDLLGVTRPAHFLLFNVDSDEMRSTGGFMGNFAVLTVQNGRLIGGIHLSDTATFDCNGPQVNCPYNLIPRRYSWMNADSTQFGMRDANLSPDFPTSAKFIMRMYQQEMQQYHPESDASVDGVIMITPEIIKDILKLTGPITVPGFSQAVSASNLQDVIHYYHIQNRNLGGGGTAEQKAIDGVLGSALLRKAGALSAAKQSTLMKEIIEGLSTKDVQLYFNDPRIESVLSEMRLDSSIPMPAGVDALMMTDVNVGATYFSRDMEERVTDTITFDSQGNALHNMTISYYLPQIQHLYTPIYVDSTPNHHPITYYTGVMRVLVPERSLAIGDSINPLGEPSAVNVVKCTITAFIPGCPVAWADEPGYNVWAARINSMQVGTDTLIFNLTWETPNVLKTVDGKQQYTLQLYKQAGSHISYDIVILPPTGSQITQPVATPLRMTSKAIPGVAAEFTSPSMVKDTTLTVTFSGSGG